jgi:hypothetical protein
MSIIAKTLLSYVAKLLPVRQIVAALLSQTVNTALASKSPEKVADLANTANCVLEVGAVLVAVSQKLAAALADGTISQAEADDIIKTATDALNAWAAGTATPQAFKDLWRVAVTITQGSTATPAPSV